MLILAGVAIATLAGNDGLFARAKEANKKTKDTQELENITLSDYENKINQYIGEKNTNEDKILEYDFKNMNNKSTNIQLFNYEFDEDNKGIQFNGKSTYGVINLEEELIFPLTIEATIKSAISQDMILFIDPKSKTAISVGKNYITCTVNKNSETYKTPSDFYDGNLKNIAVTYKTLTECTVYINGEEIEKYGKKSSLTSNIPSSTYLGSRNGQGYFNGNLYNFRIYNKLLSKDEILDSYINNKNNLTENTNKIERNNIIYEMYINKIQDLTGNKSYLVLYNENYDEDNKEIKFNGKSTYGVINLEEELMFPLTIEATIKSAISQDMILFIDPKSKAAISVGKDYITCTVDKESETYKTPSDFYDGNLKNITVTYKTLTECTVYINGKKAEKYGKKSSLTIYIPSNMYLGSRNGNGYFEGTIYNFTIYRKDLDEEEILENYKEKIELYK